MPSQQQPTDDDVRLGLNIRAARERSGRSQTALAEQMAQRGFSAWRQTTVSRLEHGDRRLSVGEAEEIDRLLGAEIWEGTQLQAAARKIGRALTDVQIEQRLDKLSTDVEELRGLWAQRKSQDSEGIRRFFGTPADEGIDE